MKWFGKSWGAPVCSESEHVFLTPIVVCERCKKMIVEGDCGLIIPYMYFPNSVRTTLSAYHLSCFEELIVAPAATADTEPEPTVQKLPSRQPGDWTPPVERPLKRMRRTDDGTYPNVGEELAKIDQRARASSTDDYKNKSFDPDLSPNHEYNRKVAQAKGVRFSGHLLQYIDVDGCPIYDQFGQKL